MSTTQTTSQIPPHQTINIGELTLRTRLTVASLRRLKEEGGIDLTTDDPGPILQLKTNPDFVLEVCYFAYKDQFDKANLSELDFANLCGVEEIEQLRKEVDQQMRGFSIFWQTVSTTITKEMENVQAGHTSELLKAAMNSQDLSGPSS